MLHGSLMECVINISEGRNPQTLDLITEAIINNGAVHLLDTHIDKDHNRSVFTIVGNPDEVETAIFEGIRTAAELIDLDQHKGQHPRLGAADVVPFIPINDITMEDCVARAKKIGQRVGNELNIPVFLYGEAATSPARRNLAHLRKQSFQYEQLKTAIEIDPDYMPDFGPAKLSSAGASLIGARSPLIAFNVFLDTTDISIAKDIAKQIRASNDGLLSVKALGLMVNGQAQVSMNLVNYHESSIHHVLDAIKNEAEHYGISIESSELIGLAPRQVFMDSAIHYWQLNNPANTYCLEDAIESALQSSPPLKDEEPPIPDEATRFLPPPEFDDTIQPSGFVKNVAKARPTPGGGSVSALVGSLGAALGEMVAGLAFGRDDAETQDDIETALVTLKGIRTKLLDYVVKDSVAYNEVVQAYRLPKENSHRDQVIQDKLLIATQIPLDIAQQSLETLHVLSDIAPLISRSAVSDCAVGAYLAKATIESAILTTKVNLRNIVDSLTVDGMRTQMETMLQDAPHLLQNVVSVAKQRNNLVE